MLVVNVHVTSKDTTWIVATYGHTHDHTFNCIGNACSWEAKVSATPPDTLSLPFISSDPIQLCVLCSFHSSYVYSAW